MAVHIDPASSARLQSEGAFAYDAGTGEFSRHGVTCVHPTAADSATLVLIAGADLTHRARAARELEAQGFCAWLVDALPEPVVAPGNG